MVSPSDHWRLIGRYVPGWPRRRLAIDRYFHLPVPPRKAPGSGGWPGSAAVLTVPCTPVSNGKRVLTVSLQSVGHLLPANRRRLVEMHIRSVRRDGIDMLRKRTKQPRSLPFATGILVRRLFLLALHDGVVAEARPAVLIGDSNVVDGLFNFSGVPLIVRDAGAENAGSGKPRSCFRIVLRVSG